MVLRLRKRRADRQRKPRSRAETCLNAVFVACVDIYHSEPLRMALLSERPQVIDVRLLPDRDNDVRFRLLKKLSNMLKTQTTITSCDHIHSALVRWEQLRDFCNVTFHPGQRYSSILGSLAISMSFNGKPGQGSFSRDTLDCKIEHMAYHSNLDVPLQQRVTARSSRHLLK